MQFYVATTAWLVSPLVAAAVRRSRCSRARQQNHYFNELENILNADLLTFACYFILETETEP